MSTNRVAVVEANLDAYLESAVAASDLLAPDAPLRVGTGLTARVAVELWEDQVLSRCLDAAARELKRDATRALNRLSDTPLEKAKDTLRELRQRTELVREAEAG